MQKNYTTEETFTALLTASNKIHKKEAGALAAEVALIKRAYLGLHGGPPPARHARKTLL